MSRPKPKVLLEFANKDNYKVEQILEADAIWAVFYNGAPFNLKSGSLVTSYPGPKYKKVSFSNPGHAFNLARKLNKLFKTESFEVVKLTKGEVINSNDKQV
mgnify:CR=1 FL=1|jgi:hypothetical protein